jgi:hypothetical protein
VNKLHSNFKHNSLFLSSNQICVFNSKLRHRYYYCRYYSYTACCPSLHPAPRTPLPAATVPVTLSLPRRMAVVVVDSVVDGAPSSHGCHCLRLSLSSCCLLALMVVSKGKGRSEENTDRYFVVAIARCRVVSSSRRRCRHRRAAVAFVLGSGSPSSCAVVVAYCHCCVQSLSRAVIVAQLSPSSLPSPHRRAAVVFGSGSGRHRCALLCRALSSLRAVVVARCCHCAPLSLRHCRRLLTACSDGG